MDEEWLNEPEVVKRRASHIRSCCAEGCTSKGYRLLVEGERVQYFPFPLFDQDMCHRWAQSVRLPPETPFSKSYVCSKHFRQTDYKARNHDDGKRTLRRTALPSCDPVVYVGKPTKKKQEFDSSPDDSDYDEEEEHTVVRTLFTKNAKDGDTLSLLVVKDPDEDGYGEENEAALKLKVLEESSKAPILIQNLIDLGAPFPWRKQGLGIWANERMVAHTDQFEKVQLAYVEEEEKLKILRQQVEAGREILALGVIKRTMGRQVLSQFLRSLS